jgi:hypothetical protein
MHGMIQADLYTNLLASCHPHPECKGEGKGLAAALKVTLNSAIISSTLSVLLINRRTGMPWGTNHIAQREAKQRSWNMEVCH